MPEPEPGPLVDEKGPEGDREAEPRRQEQGNATPQAFRLSFARAPLSGLPRKGGAAYSTVRVFARFLGWSTFSPFSRAIR